MTDESTPPDTTVPSSSIKSAPPRWILEVRRRLEELLLLGDGWDSYGGHRIEPENAQAALELLQLVMRDDTAIPEIIPTSAGSVQIEWGSGEDFVEVEVVNRAWFNCAVQSGQGSPVEEFLVKFDTSPLRDRVARFQIISAA